MELSNAFENLASMAIPLVPLVFGMVEFLKSALELEGKAVTWMSFGVGTFYGTAIFLNYLFPEWGPYIAAGTFIPSFGLVASGFYKFIDARVETNNNGAG